VSGGTVSDQVVSRASRWIYGRLGQWNTTSVPKGTYTLQSVASYPKGVSDTSTGIMITVNN
jgi:hypothetical protein